MTDLKKQAKDHSKDTEPVLRPAVVSSVFGGLLTAGATLGLDLDPTQIAAIGTLAAFVLPILAGLVARKGAFSPASVVRLITEIGDEIRGRQGQEAIDEHLSKNDLKLVSTDRLAMLEEAREKYEETRPRDFG